MSKHRSSDVKTILRCKDLSDVWMVHASERYPYIGVPMWTSDVWIAFRCMDPLMYGPSDGRRRGSFSVCRGSNLWISLYPLMKKIIVFFKVDFVWSQSHRILRISGTNIQTLCNKKCLLIDLIYRSH